jgi:MFS family permease
VAPLLTLRFWTVWFANLFQTMAFFLFLHYPAFLKDLGADEAEIGLIFGVTAFASILVRPQVGKEMDRRGRRPIMLTGSVLNVGVLALYLTVNSLGPWVYVVRVLHGLAVALLFTSLFTYGADIIPHDRRTQGLALFGVSGMLTLALAGLLGDVVLRYADFDALFIVAIGFAAASLLTVLPLRESASPAAGDYAPAGAFRETLAQRDLLPVWMVTGVFATALTGYFTFLKTFVAETGAGSVSLFFGAYAGTAITLRLVAGWLPDRIGQKRVLYPALLLVMVGFVVLATLPTDAGVFAAGLLCGAGHGYTFPILYAFVVSRSRDRQLGSASSIFTGLFDLGTLVGGPALGLIISAGGYTAMFVAAACWLAAGAIAFVVWERSMAVSEPA